MALGTLQEACEDWHIEFFQDSYVLAAHAHRVTVMPRDTQSLRLLRFRYDSLLHPVPLNDSRMDRIISIPPIQRVRVVEVTEACHSRVTQSTTDRVVTEEPIVEEAPKNANAEETQRVAEEG